MLRGPDERLKAIATLLVAVLVAIVVRLFWLQVLDHEQYQAAAQELLSVPYSMSRASWGVILDRNGDLLVGNTRTYDVSVHIDSQTPVTAPMVLASALGVPEQDIAPTLKLGGTDSRVGWRLLQPQVSPAVSDAVSATIRAKGWTEWVTLTPSWMRFYPEGALACHLLGGVTENGNGYGVQAAMVRLLKGVDVM